MPVLTKIQVASSKLSQTWKEQSQKLLLGAANLNEFEDAIIWCGKGGNVTRTLPKTEVHNFAKYLWDNKKDIISGKYMLSSLPKFGKKPISWVAKVCHIINPNQYPYIYDDKIRKCMKIKNLVDFENMINSECKNAHGKSAHDIFEQDSNLWASML